MKRKYIGPDKQGQIELRRLFHIDDLGRLIRLAPSGHCHPGEIAGTIQNNRYRAVSFRGARELAHRLAWLYYYGEWPADDIDHINGNRDDNRISNLRLASRSQNNVNSVVPKNNTSGHKGAYYDKRRGHWVAEIWVYKRKIWLGSFPTTAEAGAAYQGALRLHYGEFAGRVTIE